MPCRMEQLVKKNIRALGPDWGKLVEMALSIDGPPLSRGSSVDVILVVLVISTG